MDIEKLDTRLNFMFCWP